jgi:hypothetical protein
LLACLEGRDRPFAGYRHRGVSFLHLGLLPGSETQVPEQFRRSIDRMGFGPKTLINFEYFKDRVVESAEPGLLILGRRSLSDTCRIERASFLTSLRAVTANCVVGLGLFQGLEFLLERSPWELVGKLGLAGSRLRNSVNLILRSHCCIAHLGRNTRENAESILAYAAGKLTK